MIKHLLILILSLCSLNCFGQVDSNDNYSKKEVEKIVKEIRLIYNFYEIDSEMDPESENGSIFFRSTVPVPGIGAEEKSMIWQHPHECPGDYYALVTNFSGPFEVRHEEFIKYKSPDCFYEHFDTPFNKLKYFGDKETDGLIFYFEEYDYFTPAEDPEKGSEDYPISISKRAYYYKNKLIKVILNDKIENLKEVYYYPFKGMERSILNELQNIKCPEPY